MSDKKEGLKFGVKLMAMDSDGAILGTTSNEKIKPINILYELEKVAYCQLFHYFAGNQTKIAQALGVNRGTARTKLKKYGLIGG